MKTKRTKFPNGVILADWGLPEYLDGAQMQFYVEIAAPKMAFGKMLAYFTNKDDAELFAKAKSKSMDSPIGGQHE